MTPGAAGHADRDDEDGDAFGEVFEADAGVVLAAAEGEGCSRGGVEGISLR